MLNSKPHLLSQKNAFLSASAHLTLIIASFQGRPLSWVGSLTLYPQCGVERCVMARYSPDIWKEKLYFPFAVPVNIPQELVLGI